MTYKLFFKARLYHETRKHLNVTATGKHLSSSLFLKLVFTKTDLIEVKEKLRRKRNMELMRLRYDAGNVDDGSFRLSEMWNR